MNQTQTSHYDSEFCGNLPIHFINVLQSYGALLVIDKQSHAILQVSENVTSLFHVPFEEVPGKDIFSLVQGSNMFASEKLRLPQQLEINKRRYLGISHDAGDCYVLEINLESQEEAVTTTFIDVYHELKESISEIESAESTKNALNIAARELKRVSQFDKVMMYRFDDNWNGNVAAEEMETGMEPYLGVTFPASDIPKQARDLYQKNAYRFIPDRNYTPVKLFPVISPATSRFLDLSDCNVRGVSLVHIEYLKNMGVVASMSTRILKDGKLWGLIACHHRTAMRMNYKMCTIFEFLSGVISSKISALDQREKHLYDTHLSALYTGIIEEAYRKSQLIDSLLHEDINILKLFNAAGAAVIQNGNITRKGTMPEVEEIEDIVLWLNTKDLQDIYYTNSLSREYDYAEDYKDVGSGLLAIPIDTENDEYILLFRPEVLQVINWGGDPNQRMTFEPDMKTYHPRFSFKIWQEKVMGIAYPWKSEEIEMAINLREFVKAFLNGKDYSYTH